MGVRRMAKLGGENVVSYVHNAAAPGMGKIGVLVAFTGGDEGFARQVAMHVAAVNPAALNEDELDPAIVEKEKQVQMDIARESGKPEAVIEKMIEGRMKKFLAEVTLVNQQFVVNPDLTVGPPPRRPASRSPASSGSRSAKASRWRRKTSPPRSPRPPRADATDHVVPGPGASAARGREACPAFRLGRSDPAKTEKTAPHRDKAVPFSAVMRARLGDNAHAGVKGDTTGEITRGGAPPTRKPGCGCHDAKMAPLDPMFLAGQLPSLAEHHQCAIFVAGIR
jgi:hypothetical protein